MIIIVSGFAGSGKSSLADSLGKHFKFKVIHASDAMKQLTATGKIDFNKTKGQTGFWESNEAKKIMKKRNENDELDKKLDELLLNEIKKIGKKGLVLDSWTMPWLSKKGIKIWLEAGAELRAKRVSGRDKMHFRNVLKKIRERDKKTAAIYRRIYGFSMGKDFKPFDLVLNTNNLNQKEVYLSTVKGLKKLMKEEKIKKTKKLN